MATTLKSYQHIQSTPADTWVISHNLGITPVVDVFVYVDGVLTKILPQSIEITSSNVVTVNFSSLFTGQARII